MLLLWFALLGTLESVAAQNPRPIPKGVRAIGIRCEGLLPGGVKPGALVDLVVEGRGQKKFTLILKNIRVFENMCSLSCPRKEPNEGEIVLLGLTSEQMTLILPLLTEGPRPRFSLTVVQERQRQ